MEIIQTPTQIAIEIMKGCGKKYLDWFCNGEKISIVSGDSKGSVRFNKIYLCPTCKKVNQTHKQDWEGELEVLIEISFALKGEWKPWIIGKRISILTQALKILEGGK